jgi:hypothetical protein
MRQLVTAASASRRFAQAVCCAGVLAAGTPATAQQCDSPITIQDDVIDGDTCTGTPVAASFCGGTLDNPGPNLVYSFRIAAPIHGSISISGGGPGFDPSMYLGTPENACSGGPCIAAGNISSSISLDGLAIGEYDLVIAAASGSQAGSCGPFQLVLNYVVVDLIFEDSFDP